MERCPGYNGSTDGQEGRSRLGCLGLRVEVGFIQVYRRKRTVADEGMVLAKVWSVRQHTIRIREQELFQQ